ncbi:hypothetical protein H7B90_20520 [Cohnella xylanilytica]|uniref:Uncharacterized protein n=1 Tax=Cohnella xylanilytica TaxID=557555 RepID=A0A841TZT7_9BACL|nr:hypothetical protein [Cohnella xylanilytica]MBB6693786.1 hypothetical protein [Cohnella xylanilytica]
MHVISTFEHSSQLELAILSLEQDGIERGSIAAVPMEPVTERPPIPEAIHRMDGSKFFDIGALLSTVFSVLGASIGFRLRWGPIIWGIIGVAAGVAAAFVLWRLAGGKSSRPGGGSRPVSEVVLIVRCDESEAKRVIGILKKFSAGRIGKLG